MPGGGGAPHIGYKGMCHWKGYGFQAIIYSGIGSSNLRKLVWNRSFLTGLLTKDSNQEQSSIFTLVKGHKI